MFETTWKIPDTHLPNTARAICTLTLCHTVSVNSHEIHAPSLGSGASVGGGEVEVVSRRSGSGSDYDQWKLSVKSKNHTPSSAKRRSSKRPPNLTNLGRASDETVVLHMAGQVSFAHSASNS